MKITYSNPDGRLHFELEAASIKDAFLKVSMLQDAFEADTHCGLCNSENIRYEHRLTGDGFNYYAMRCNACNAELSFGQKLTGGGLFVKRDKGTTESRGWYHYQGGQQAAPPEEYDQRYKGPPEPATQRSTASAQGQSGRGPMPPAARQIPNAQGITDDDIPF